MTTFFRLESTPWNWTQHHYIPDDPAAPSPEGGSGSSTVLLRLHSESKVKILVDNDHRSAKRDDCVSRTGSLPWKNLLTLDQLLKLLITIHSMQPEAYPRKRATRRIPENPSMDMLSSKS